MKRVKLLGFALPVLIGAFALSSVYPVFKNQERGELTAYFLDAGETKSAALFILPGGANVLIDGGYSKYDRNGYIERTVINRFLVYSGVRKIDYLILPTVDKDHISGAKFLLDNFEVGSLLTNGDKLDGGIWERIREQDINWKDMLHSEVIPLSGHVVLEALKPEDTFTIRDSSLPHPLFLKLTYEDQSFLLCESVYGGEAETSLLKPYGKRLRSTVLYYPKIEEGSPSAAFIRAVSPELVITDSVDKDMRAVNSDSPLTYGLKHLYQTAKDGAVTLITNGENMRVNTYNSEKDIHMQ